MSESGNDDVPALLAGLLVVFFFCMNIWFKQRRANRLEEWAQEQGLQYFGAELPREFPIQALDEAIGSWGSALDTIGGRRGEDYLLTFQIERGYGRQAWLQTVVARRSLATRSRHTAIGHPYEYLQAGEWRIVLSPRPFILRPARISRATVLRLWALLA